MTAITLRSAAPYASAIAVIGALLAQSAGLLPGVDATVVLDHLFELIFPPVVAWVGAHAAALLRVQRDDRLVARLEEGLTWALEFAQQTVAQRLAETAGEPDRAAIAAIAADYLEPKMPQALASLGITRKGLEDRLFARVDAVLPTPRTASGGVAVAAG